MVIWEHLKNTIGNIDASLTTTIDSKKRRCNFYFWFRRKIKNNGRR